MALCAWLSACAWRGEGLVHGAALGPMLETSTGERYKLVYGEDDRMLAYLDGHMVVMEGRRIGRTLKVGEWSIPAGLHGLNVWYGTLERRGVQLGLQDRNSGAYYFLGPDVTDALAPYVGEDVLVEGYVVGNHLVKVLHHQVLAKRD
ncbi:MAG: hypothetical protein H6737_25290 [Alphaproteobacteria bacterium]|nr:hypothetical protein [Alphaproteobacteria bacterium]